MQKKIKFTIITVTYNSAKYLRQTIESVASQSYPNVEYIFVDGGSTDGTLDLIKKYEGKISKWISEKDGGISDALNKGIKMASGDVIGIIHADDWYESGALECAAAAFESSGADIICGKVMFYKNEKPDLVYESSPDLLEKEMTVQHPSVFIKKSVYEKEGGFDLKYKYAMDYDLLLRLKRKGYKFHNVKSVIANMRYDGKSDINWFKTLGEARAVKIANGIHPSAAWLYYFKQLARMSVSRALQSSGFEAPVRLYRKYFSMVRKERFLTESAAAPLNILFISSRADVGGGPLQMFDIISNIDRSRFTPFAALPAEKPFYGKIAALGVKTVPIAKRAVSIADIARLLAFVYFNNIHVIHSHGKGAGVYSRILKFLYPCVKVVHTYHGFHYDGLSQFKAWIHKSAEKVLARFTDRFVSVSEGEQLQYAMAGLFDFKRSVVIKNQVPLGSLGRIAEVLKSPKFSANDAGGRLYFCAVARFDPVKQMPFLVESFVRAAGSPAVSKKVGLKLIGGGEEFEKCRAIARSMCAGPLVEFLGERSDALEIMAGCDAYVSASRREGLSMSMLEAVACGLPILAPRVPGIAELVRPYEKGVMFENGDYESFKTGLVKIVEKCSEARNENVNEKADGFASKYEEHRNYIQKYEKLYIETLNG